MTKVESKVTWIFPVNWHIGKTMERKMGKLIIGIQMYTLRDFCKTRDEFVRTAEEISKIGYRVVQPFCAVPIDAKELKKILDDNGFYSCSTHVPYQQIVDDTDNVIETHKILGCEAIICPWLPEEVRNKEGYLKVAKGLEKTLPRIKKAGLKLGYHNHGFEFEKYEGKTGLEILLENCKELEAEIDTYWVQYGGGDPALWIEKYSGRVNEIHVKDMGIDKNKQVMPPIGTGNLNWDRIVTACKNSAVKYCLVEMDFTTINAFEAVKISFENMKSWGMESKLQ